MPTIENVLTEQTYKNDHTETGRRVYETLRDDKVSCHHRTAKLLSLLIQELETKGILSEADIDSLLLDTIP